MSDRVRFMKFDTVDTLKADKENNSARYVKGFEWDKYLPSDYFRESSVPIDASKFNKIKLPDGGDNHDIYNSLFVYNLFNELTPEQAYDERVWTYYSHTIFHDYVVSRWIDGSSNKDRSIRSHMFVHGDRGLVRDNGIARLWWMGFIAHNIASQIPFSVEHVLNILLFKADVRSNIIERPSSAANMKISAAIIILLAESYNGKQNLFKKETFRDFMKIINMIGGTTLLDVFDIDMTKIYLRDIITKQLRIKNL